MQRLMRIALSCVVLLVLGAAVSRADAAEPMVLSFGVSPQHSPVEQAKLWVPICQYLSRRTGYQFQFKTSKDLPTYWKEADAGAFDLLYINPYYFIKAQKAAGYRALGKDGGTPLVGIIVARHDGPDEIEGLKGEKIATHDVNAFMTSYVRYGYLKEAGIQIEPVGVGSLDSVYLAVNKGLYPAGISIQRAFGLLDPTMQKQFKVLWKSDPLPPFAYAVHPRVAPQVIEDIRQAMLGMNNDAEGRALLAKVNVKAIVGAKDSDFNSLRKLKLE